MPKYRCLKCGYKFMREGPSSCVMCGHDYVKWENYREIKHDRGNT